MSSSISNSSIPDSRPADPAASGSPRGAAFPSVGRALLVCLLLLVAYQGLIAGGRVPASDGVGQSENNRIRAQDYAGGLSGVPDLVLVGTSLTANLKAEYFGPRTVNLGLSGGSVRTGLALVLRAPRKPQTLLVEVDDKLPLPPDDGLLNAATGLRSSLAGGALPALREEYRPMGVLVSGLKQWVKRRHGAGDSDRDTVPVPPAVREQLITQTLAQDAAPPSPEQQETLRAAAADLQRDISRLRQGGVRVVLFEPPGEPVVQSSVRLKGVRALLHALFPDGRYRWLAAPPPQPWTTSDGTHLVRADAHRYAEFVLAQLSQKPGPVPRRPGI